MTQYQKRRIKLIKPRLQVRLILAFVAVAVLALLLQYLLVAQRLAWTAAHMPVGGAHLMDEIPHILLVTLGLSFGVLFPLTFAVGVLVTFRIAGPVYRFEQYLREVAQGRDPGECRLRHDDELQDVCELLNEVRARTWGRAGLGFESVPGEETRPEVRAAS